MYSSVKGNSGCFNFLSVMNRESMNMSEQISVKLEVKFLEPYAKEWYSWLMWYI